MSHDNNAPSGRPQLSIVVPCYNEERGICETNRRLLQVARGLGLAFEIVYVDDGSTDATWPKLDEMRAGDDHIRLVRLSRNFGHQIAITAGLEHASGDAVVIIDADLQDPPEVIPEMVARWCEGWNVAYGYRTERDGENIFKLKTAKMFYRLINLLSSTPIPVDTGDFRLMDRKVVDALLAMQERDRFVRGMVSWIGFRQIAVPYRRAPRFAGSTKYPLTKMVRFALDGILSFSIAPLKLAILIGFGASLLALIGAVVAVWNRIWTNDWVIGWTSLFLAILLLGGVQLICIGIMGEYLGRMYGEAKRRPLYFVEERLGFESSAERSHREAAQAGMFAVSYENLRRSPSQPDNARGSLSAAPHRGRIAI